jgi:hypothetical protein
MHDAEVIRRRRTKDLQIPGTEMRQEAQEEIPLNRHGFVVVKLSAYSTNKAGIVLGTSQFEMIFLDTIGILSVVFYRTNNVFVLEPLLFLC